ncbi:hypothetical protein N657DRAFT_566327 [Parathielavia appendiculata]|uniref:Uncharacterized protein n=1 Tax=Parathielavia appendiculata TaxID=2587402 RepID=A0AAN6U5P8_9PEZI|nr:hypothetical protein N657DRAFT_566327 [Parathielavia appendiculata]
MNRFRTKKRAKDDLAAGRSSEESEHASLSFFRKGKKAQQEEVKKEFDLANALPSDDNFRTSLLMSNLSARFSMLREQDDPNTKIGKASDDSVLYPKRQSRLADFGYGGVGGLTDIAEVESIRGHNFLRTTSVASDDPDSGAGASVLTRARPTEGNNLFGGRQKIYKIPANSGGGLSGRALYEDDVATSAFQRWRLAEKERTLALQSDAEQDGAEEESGNARPESPPPMGYNRKRETSSTTSSASNMARNSTAATSVTSKDGHSAPTVATSAIASIPERSVTRTRRLYEQGFNQDVSENQSSVLSRIENLTRPRPFANTAEGNRAILTKASAPNLRSMSPASTGRSTGPLNLGSKVQTEAEPGSLGGLPPLSPPVSESGEQPMPSIVPKDVGKSTAMGIFQKSSQPYDESQYVQRQLQLQQGREAPTQRHRAGTSDQSVHNFQDHATSSTTITARPALPDTRLPPTPITDTEITESTTAVSLAGLSVPVEIDIERPSDKDHPAFRQSALPTPLSIGGRISRDPSPVPKPKVSTASAEQPSPDDSPTLGPAAGLSGLVRQHLRTESVDSSLGGAGVDISAPESRFKLDSQDPSAASELGLGASLSPWPSSDQDWVRSVPGKPAEPTPKIPEGEIQAKREATESETPNQTSTATDDETDEFANQLANARRRVREKLTSYVESDSSRAPSPLLMPTDSPSLSAQSSNALGILKPKSSRGSLIDRSRNMVHGQSKGLKILGLGGATVSAPPQPGGNPSFEEKDTGNKDEDSNAHPGLKAFRQARRELQRRKELEMLARHQREQTLQSADESLDQRNGVHSEARADRGPQPRQRTPSRERRLPPVTYRQRPPSDEGSYKSPGGTQPSGERSRSGSETSGGRSSSRPPRLRTNTNTGQYEQLGPPNSGRPMMRSPGLPGTDIKGSPMMPPYPYPSRGAPSPASSPHPDRSRQGANLALHTGRPGLDPHSGQPSPISPMGLPSPAPYTMGPSGSPVGTPTSLGPRPRGPSASHSPALGPMNGGMPGPVRRPVDKREISDPTFVMSSSRVHATTLPHHSQHHPPPLHYPPPPHQPPPMIPNMGDGARPYGGPRSRSNSRAAGSAPPVPPINPRRRRDDSRTRALQEEGETTAFRVPFSNQAAPGMDHGAGSDDEGGNRTDQRRRLRKPHPNTLQGPSSRHFTGSGRPRDDSPPLVAKGPPVSRTVATSDMGGVPGGMF